ESADMLYARLVFLAPFLLAGAVAARLGPTIAPWRGALATGLTCLSVILLGVVLTRDPIDELAVVGVPLTTIGSALGYFGGFLARFCERKTTVATCAYSRTTVSEGKPL